MRRSFTSPRIAAAASGLVLVLLVLVPAVAAGRARVTVSPHHLNFGRQPVGTTSAPQLVTVTNESGEPLAAGSWTFESQSGPWRVDTAASTCVDGANSWLSFGYTLALAAGASCTFAVEFAPTTTANLTQQSLTAQWATDGGGTVTVFDLRVGLGGRGA